jgi:hypothetical protein
MRYSVQSPPIYVSERSTKNLWQSYRVFEDRIELRCWALFSTLVIPAHDILDVQVRGPFGLGDLFRGRVKVSWWVLKLDFSDLCEHVELHRKSGLFKHLRFTPDFPADFAAACDSIRAPQR